MAYLEIKNVKISGISACVPKEVEHNIDLPIFEGEEAQKLINSTGIEQRRVAPKGICTSDLCFHAAEQLILDLGWNKNDIDCLIFVTQTPDYIIPATSCILQDRLGLGTECYTLDVSLGCSGWVYGMSTIGSLLTNGNMRKGLLLVGDIATATCSRNDKSTYPLFGDSGSATAFEYDDSATGFKFHFSTDGSGYRAIIIEEGPYGCRNQITPLSFEEKEIEPGIIRNPMNIILDGMDVFSFAISKAPESINKLTDYYDIDSEKVDYFVFHQANMFLNEKIRKKLKLSAEKVPYSLKEFGNTSSASIPLTIVTQLKDKIKTDKLSFIACGFGIGLSWGSVLFDLNKIVCSNLIEI